MPKLTTLSDLMLPSELREYAEKGLHPYLPSKGFVDLNVTDLLYLTQSEIFNVKNSSDLLTFLFERYLAFNQKKG